MMNLKTKITCPSLSTFWSYFIIIFLLGVTFIFIIYALIFWSFTSLWDSLRNDNGQADLDALNDKSQLLREKLDHRESF